MTEDEKSQFKIDFEMNKKYSFKNNGNFHQNR
jgi:hypothetical protein